MKKKINIKYTGKGQVKRLIDQHERSKGVKGIFRPKAKSHDISVNKVAIKVFNSLEVKYKNLNFRHRKSVSKKEINSKLNSFDTRLGKVLFVENSNIKPDGGIIEVQDRKKNWRIILVSESKHQGNDIEKIKAGIKQGKNKDQDLMVAGNAIERVHKNILEIRNIMMYENHFPYVVFLQGTNFATKTHFVKAPDGRKIKIAHNVGNLSRIR